MSQLFAFTGVMLVFVASLFLLPNPIDPKALGQTIYVPYLLSAELEAHGIDLARTPSHRAMIELTGSQMNFVIPFIWIVSAISAFRRRWVFVSLSTAFMLFPWEVFGFHISARPIFVATILLIGAIRLYNPGRKTSVLLLFVGGILGLQIVGLVANTISPLIPKYADGKPEYHALNFKKLSAGGAATDAPNGYALSISSFEELRPSSPAEGAAIDFVLAQEFFMRSDPVRAGQYANRALSDTNKLNRFDLSRLELIRDFAAFSGTDGEAIKQSAEKRYEIRGLTVWTLMLLGGSIALLGPFSDVLANRIRRRSIRIGAVRKELDALADANSEETIVRGRNHSLFEVLPVGSIASVEAEGTLKTFKRRIFRHLIAAVLLAFASVIAFYLHGLFWLPKAVQNTAFDNVGLLRDVARDLVRIGVLNLAGFGNDGFGVWLRSSPILFLSVPLLMLILLKDRRPAILMLSVMLIIGGAKLLAPNHDPRYAADASQISLSAREYLASRVRLSDADTTVLGGEELSLRSGEAEISSKEHGSDSKTSAANSHQTNSDHAAFTLAQLAYLENDVETTAAYLNAVGNPEAFTVPFSRSRLLIMNEWVYGHDPSLLRSSWTQRSLSIARIIAVVSETIALLAAGSAIVLLLLAGVSEWRRRTLGRLIAQRKEDRPIRSAKTFTTGS